VKNHSIELLNKDIIKCRDCDRLVEFRESIAIKKRKQYQNWQYWGKPVPGYGDFKGSLLLIGLAPAAHGGNRTGRVFTGDKSAEFLVRCLYEVGIANQPNSDSRDDGLLLFNAYMTPVLKCVPPFDKPKPNELLNCSQFFNKELVLLKNVSCILALGKIAFDSCLRYFRNEFHFLMKDYPFGHGNRYMLENGITIIGSYHPSPRNVNTGRLSQSMMIDLLEEVKKFIK
tara:strand:- start:2693 stop:3376 length:684 start_codon:yes stop_codon:yes gene_type:complete